VEVNAKLSGYQVAPPQTLFVNNTRLGWSAKVFRVESLQLTFEQQSGEGGEEMQVIVSGTHLALREEDSSIYSWTAATDETTPATGGTVTAPQILVNPAAAFVATGDPTVRPAVDGATLLGGVSGLASARVPEVLQSVGGVGMIKAGKFVDANMGMKTVAQDLVVGSTSGGTAGWRIVATAAISVPVGTASVTLEMVAPPFSGSGTLTLDLVSNLGFSISNGAGPSTPQVARDGSGSLTQNSPVTGVGLTLSLYFNVDTSGASLSINNGKIRQDVITPLAIGKVT